MSVVCCVCGVCVHVVCVSVSVSVCVLWCVRCVCGSLCCAFTSGLWCVLSVSVWCTFMLIFHVCAVLLVDMEERGT